VTDTTTDRTDGLALVQDFVNTFASKLGSDFEIGDEDLVDPAALETWMREHRLPVAKTPTREDLRSVIAFREALRRLLLANNGVALDADSVALLARTAEEAELRVHMDEQGTARLAAAGEGVRALFGRILGAMARAQEDGSWRRLKACPASDCHWAFFDRSRNSSRTWCAMGVCGNRAKTRAYRARRK
jgi:predicted RNA-binding Zn ribbon-like protein